MQSYFPLIILFHLQIIGHTGSLNQVSEVQIVIMVTNCITSSNGGHQLMKQAGPTSFTKIRAKILRPQNQTPSIT